MYHQIIYLTDILFLITVIPQIRITQNGRDIHSHLTKRVPWRGEMQCHVKHAYSPLQIIWQVNGIEVQSENTLNKASIGFDLVNVTSTVFVELSTETVNMTCMVRGEALSEQTSPVTIYVTQYEGMKLGKILI